MEIDKLNLNAPAKVNLILRVIGKREDGYHNLETWMQKIDLCDKLSIDICRGAGVRLECRDKGIPSDQRNLVWQAAELFLSRSHNASGFGVSICLEKNIPVSAGLGGGSSDAGAVLKGLNDHFGNEFNQEQMIAMGKGLGADVPFFVTEMDAVLATGIGEKMIPVPSIGNCIIVLVNPGIFISTQWVFEKFALTRIDKNSKLTGSHKLSPADLNFSAMENDLEEIVIAHYPVIDEIKSVLTTAGSDNVLMSGSGSTVFGIFTETDENQTEITGAVEKLRKKFGEKVFVVNPRNGV